MSQIQEQLESVPGYDIAMDKFNDFAGDHFNGTNPFEDEHGNKRQLGPHSTAGEKRVWRQIQKAAWAHDRCFLGLCAVGLDCGLGWVPLAVFFFPGLGPIITYVIHARLIALAHEEMHLPGKLEAKLQGNILIDFLISLPPILGAFLSWLNACLTRNAGILYVYMEKVGAQRGAGQLPVYLGPKGPGAGAEKAQMPPGDVGAGSSSKADFARGRNPGLADVGVQQLGFR